MSAPTSLMRMERWADALALIEGMIKSGAADRALCIFAAKAARKTGDFAKSKEYLLQCIGPFGETAMHHCCLAVFGRHSSATRKRRSGTLRSASAAVAKCAQGR